jgi:hypothetical protein
MYTSRSRRGSGDRRRLCVISVYTLGTRPGDIRWGARIPSWWPAVRVSAPASPSAPPVVSTESTSTSPSTFRTISAVRPLAVAERFDHVRLLLSIAETLFGSDFRELAHTVRSVFQLRARLYLLLLQLELLRFQKLTRYAHGAVLRAQHEVPQLFAEGMRVLVQEARELDLNLLNFRLSNVSGRNLLWQS